MYRRKVMITAAAVFAFGVCFAAQPTSIRANRGNDHVQQRSLWTPGTYALMSSHETGLSPLAPPR